MRRQGRVQRPTAAHVHGSRVACDHSARVRGQARRGGPDHDHAGRARERVRAGLQLADSVFVFDVPCAMSPRGFEGVQASAPARDDRLCEDDPGQAKPWASESKTCSAPRRSLRQGAPAALESYSVLSSKRPCCRAVSRSSWSSLLTRWSSGKNGRADRVREPTHDFKRSSGTGWWGLLNLPKKLPTDIRPLASDAAEQH